MANVLETLFGMGFVPDTIICDNGSEFISKEFQAVCDRWQVKVVHTRPGYPQSNGNAERANREIKRGLAAALLEEDNAGKPWWSLLSAVICECSVVVWLICAHGP